ncbi:helix-turn-helix domain-containing protein [uncultured Parvibaculum sp.]|uniref:helix-turn-helix domain-containing protein n=1 Tax=uncultured Parvibaculum sp. TaxID=291828 RepID=UPI0030D71063|tara:strand:+ start:104752 stop:105186 length:435 start_codon:yes stop_codon:yes gene_type:complete
MEQDLIHIHRGRRTSPDRPAATGWSAAPPRRKRRRPSPARPGQDRATRTLALVAGAWQVSLPELRAPTRRRATVALARQVAMYLTHVIFGVSLSEVGRLFGRDRRTAAHACRQIEDRRDDPDFDRLLDALAARLEGGARPGSDA